jgi:hypothetical protein
VAQPENSSAANKQTKARIMLAVHPIVSQGKRQFFTTIGQEKGSFRKAVQNGRTGQAGVHPAHRDRSIRTPEESISD